MRVFVYACTLFVLCTVAVVAGDEHEDGVAQSDIDRVVRDALRHKEPLENGKPIVPTADVAKGIHRAVAGAVYGDDEIDQERPFRAVRSGEFWVIYGYMPPDKLGGVACTVIRASNGQVIWITSGQ